MAGTPVSLTRKPVSAGAGARLAASADVMLPFTDFPAKQGLYDPRFEKDACGVGFVAHIKGVKSNGVVRQGIEALKNMEHRGAAGAEPNSGDGAGILIQTPDRFFRAVLADLGHTLPEFGRYAARVLLETGVIESLLGREVGERQHDFSRCCDLGGSAR